MASNLRELKTHKTLYKEELLSYLDYLRTNVEEDKLTAAIFVVDCENTLNVQAIGDITEMEVIGLLDTAKLVLQHDTML